jgi:oxygen-independent coproporphyrinogen-3 oxidase
MAGIYIHVPFCRQACAYCDFHFSTRLDDKAAFIKAIVKEIYQRRGYIAEKNTGSIYFGGGTPSLLSEPELNAIFEALSAHFAWNENTEITLEANPDDIDEKRLTEWKKAGVNRLSIGLQSFNNQELAWMNRAHTAEESVSSVKRAQDAGFNNITIDLIYGSKFQNMAQWQKTLERAIGLGTQHISSYNLTIEDKTLLGVQHKRGREPSVSEDLSGAQFLLMRDLLEQAGFVHYEVSNFGKPGYFAKHNSSYWLQQPYLGLGPSAHSFDGYSRQWNVKNNALYIKRVNEEGAYFEMEKLEPNDRYNEYVLTRLRTIWGCDLREIKERFGENSGKHFLTQLAKYNAFVQEEKGVYTLTKEGLLQADGIASDLFIL